MGTDCRDGAVLAIEDANAGGGIGGRPIELVIRDDKQDPAEAVRADKELAAAGCKVIVGHMTSGICEAAIPWVNTVDVAMISPTASSEEFTGRKDHFYRTYVSSSHLARAQARYLVRHQACRTAATVYDDRNRAHSKVWADLFANWFEKEGGRLMGSVKFDSQDGPNYRQISQQIKAMNPDCVLVLANVLDTAMICQHLRAAGVKARIAGSEWSATKDLRRLGGKSIIGFLIASNHRFDSPEEGFATFRQRFLVRYGRPPTSLSAHGYNAALVAVQALRLSIAEHEDINKILQQPRTYEVIGQDLAIDGYGDALSSVYVGEISDTEIRTVYSE